MGLSNDRSDTQDTRCHCGLHAVCPTGDGGSARGPPCSPGLLSQRTNGESEAEPLVLGRAGSKARGHSAKELTCQRRRLRFYPWVGKIALEKEVETHSSMLGWQVPEEAGRLQSTRLQRVRHDLATKQLHYLISFPP